MEPYELWKKRENMPFIGLAAILGHVPIVQCGKARTLRPVYVRWRRGLTRC
jgi:hypothetical protein